LPHIESEVADQSIDGFSLGELDDAGRNPQLRDSSVVLPYSHHNL
jgi:hypothetical protein